MIEWRMTEGSRIAHAVDTNNKNNRKSGQRSLCGRYPNRRNEWWWSLPVSEVKDIRAVVSSYSNRVCDNCFDLVKDTA